MILFFEKFATLGALLSVGAVPTGKFRFPMPEFESGYTHPLVITPQPQTGFEIIDAAVLFLALSAAAWLVLRDRSRRGIFALTIFSILYFGFWRKGCVCPVGSLQNIVAGIADPTFPVPIIVMIFFLMPLLFALFFGRVFCAAVCPLGAVQEVVAIRPVIVPSPVERLLGLFPYIYLGLTVLSVTLGAGFIICRFDPFIGFFRQGASFGMLATGGIFLLIGIFIARPYCRFLCPYGVLLSWLSRFSKWHAVIPPTQCTQCRLCEDSCPYGAIHLPMPQDIPESRREGVKRVGLLLLLLPMAIVVGAGTGAAAHQLLSRMHPIVQLAERIAAEDRGEILIEVPESEAFRASEKTTTELYAEARAVTADFKYGSGWLGGFLGLVIGCKLIGLSIVRKRTDYEPDKAACVSCARCFPYCPVENETASS